MSVYEPRRLPENTVAHSSYLSASLRISCMCSPLPQYWTCNSSVMCCKPLHFELLLLKLCRVRGSNLPRSYSSGLWFLLQAFPTVFHSKIPKTKEVICLKKKLHFKQAGVLLTVIFGSIQFLRLHFIKL